MCIAIYSPMGNETPNEKYLRTSFENNPDGAGFAFNTDDGRVRILKGFMTWESFLETYNKYRVEYDFKNRGVLIHFRISTHGGICPECTHPFPLSSDEGALHKLTTTSNYAIIHNGIISLTSTEAGKLQRMSDTMVFISKYISKIAQYKKWFDNPVTWELLYDLADSKIAILQGDGSIKSTYGFTKDEGDGNYYSNNTYKETRVRYVGSYPYVRGYSSYSKPYTYDAYDAYDDYDDYDDYYPQSHKTKTKKKNQSRKTVPLMKLHDGDIINCAGQAYVANEQEDCGSYFVDSAGTVYFLFGEDKKLNSKNDKWISAGLMYFAEKCTVTDVTGFPRTFLADHWAQASAIY